MSFSPVSFPASASMAASGPQLLAALLWRNGKAGAEIAGGDRDDATVGAAAQGQTLWQMQAPTSPQVKLYCVPATLHETHVDS